MSHEADGEVAWVVEGGGNTYWNGKGAAAADFTSDPNEAVRFARFEDAERIRCWLLSEFWTVLGTRQHKWMRPS